MRQFRDRYIEIIAQNVIDSLNMLFDYYEQTWMRHFTPARFSVNGVAHRTNNYLETGNKRFKNSIGTNQNIFKVIGTIVYIFNIKTMQ